MPNWRKVIVSGSDAALNSLNVTTALTASSLIYPTTDGTVGQSIVTDGAGNLTFGSTTSDSTTITIKNVSGVTIQKGTPCYITGSGTSGNVAGVWPADASNSARMPAGVIAGETLTAGAEGGGIINGFINGVDTSAFAAGDSVYVAVGGGYTNVRPTGSAVFIQKLGNVEKSAINGSGVINGPAYYNEVPNIQQGYTWVGNSNGVATPVATSSIQNVVSSSYALTASYTPSIAGTDNYIPRFNGSSALENSVMYDTGTNIGIGTTSPSTKLHVNYTTGTGFTLSNTVANQYAEMRLQSADSSAYIFKNSAGYGAYGGVDALNIFNQGQIAFHSSTTSNIIYLTAAGNVGIGNTTPNEKLEISVGNGNTGGLRINYAATATSEGMDITYLNTGATVTSFDSRYNSNNAVMQFRMKTTGTPVTAMTILGNGLIGIGTTSPVGRLTLKSPGDVSTAGDGFIFQRNSNTAKLVRIYESAADGFLEVRDGGDTIVSKLSGYSGTPGFFLSDIGIGTNSPSYKLDVRGSVGFFGDSSFQPGNLTLTDVTSGGSSWSIYSGFPSLGDFTIRESGVANHLTIKKTSGNVGIGTTSPGQKLSVNGAIESITDGLSEGGQLILRGSTYRYNIDNFGGNALRFFREDDSTGSAGLVLMYITSAGNVGIGTTSPTNRLQVTGTAGLNNAITSFEGGSFVRLYADSTFSPSINWTTGNSLRFAISADNFSGFTEYMRIDPSGNVGIGTSSPNQKLDVRGYIVSDVGNNGVEGGFYLGNSGHGLRRPGGGSNDVYLYTTSGTVYIGTGGASSQQVTLLQSGNVGINETNPLAMLHFSKQTTWGSSENRIININNTGTGGDINVPHNMGSITWYSGNSTPTAEIAAYRNTPASGNNIELRFTTADAGTQYERMRITSIGTVGIGTTSPTSVYRLTIDGAGTSGNPLGGITFRQGGTDTLYFGNISTANTTDWEMWNPRNGYMRFATNNLERMRIASTGAIQFNAYGSGTFTGTATQKLAVDSSGNVIEIPIGAGPVDGTGTANYVTKWSDTDTITNSIMYDTGTNIGIGTTSPSYKLSINGSAGIEASEEYFYFHSTYSVGSNARAKIRAVGAGGGSGYGGDFRISTRATNNTWNEDAVTVDSSGNVGIGTTSPAQKLDISAGTNLNLGVSQLSLDNFSNEGIGITFSRTSSDADLMAIGVIDSDKLGLFSRTGIIFATEGSSLYSATSEKMRLTETGNLGIGITNPGKKLVVAGNGVSTISMGDAGFTDYAGISFNGTLNSGNYNIVSSPTDLTLFINRPSGNDIRFRENNVNQVTILTGGNVGIGTASPSQKLHVVGTITSADTADSGRINLGTNDANQIGLYRDNSYDLVLVQHAASGNPLYLAGAGDVRVSIDSNNNETNRKFVVGNNAIKSSNDLFFINESGNGYFAGNVGIGTTDPTWKLTILGNNDVFNVTSQTADTSLPTKTLAAFNGLYNSGGNGHNLYISSTAGTGTFEFNTTKTWGGFMSWGVSSNGTSITRHMSLTSAGNVGIGTTSPGAKLHVKDPSTSSSQIRMSAASSEANYGYLTMTDNTFNTARLTIGTTYGYNTPVDAITIFNGLVGIGTTSPSQKLHVEGNLRVTGAIYDSNNQAGSSGQVLSSTGTGTDWVSLSEISGVDGSGTANYVTKWSDTDTVTNSVIYDTGTNIGIGTTSPYTRLHVKVTGTPPTSGQQGYFGNVVLEGDANQWNRLRFDTAGTGSWGVAVNPDRKFAISRLDSSFSGTPDDSNFIIDTTGNVGIGTTSPGAKLHVSQPSANTIFRLGNNASYDQFIYFNGGNDWSLGMDYSNSNAFVLSNASSIGTNDRLVVTTAGNVGIGTTSPASVSNYKALTLDATSGTFTEYRQGGTNILRIGVDGSRPFLYGDSNAPLDFFTNASFRMRLAANGDLLVGTQTSIHGTSGRGVIQINGSSTAILSLSTGDTDAGYIYHTGTNMYLWNYKSGAMFLGTSNVERITILAGGNVGIGTTTPGTALQVIGTTSATNFSTTAGNYNGYGFWGGVGGNDYSIWMADTATAGGQLTGGSGNDYNMYFKMNYSNRGFIFITGDNTSHFQITNEGAFVKGNIKLTSTAGSTSTPSYIWLGNDYSDGYTRDKLKVYLYNSGTEQYGFGVGSIGDIQYHSNVYHSFYIGNTFSTTINSTGMGIGTSTPSQPLHVNGNIRVGGAYYDSNNQAGSSGQILSSTGTGTDWVSLSSISGVDGTGTANYVPKWTDADTIGNSAIYDNSGNIGIGTTNPGAKLEVVGSFRATTKSFIIDHPTKEGKKLQYGVLEGPEHSVYVRGKLTGTRRIELPDYWHALIHEDSITVNLTAIGRGQQLWVEEITDTYIMVGSESGIVNCFYTVFAERKDVDKLITEFDKE